MFVQSCKIEMVRCEKLLSSKGNNFDNGEVSLYMVTCCDLIAVSSVVGHTRVMLFKSASAAHYHYLCK